MAREAFEVLFHGTRGNGKTAGLIMAFANEVGCGYGAKWRGIIFRNTYAQLRDVQAKCEEWFYPAFGNNVKCTGTNPIVWKWKTGETLLLSYMNSPQDYAAHHGQEYAFIGWEELTNWADPTMYDKMMSTLRSTQPNMPLMCRATCNPTGVGHIWVKERFKLAGDWYLDKVMTRSDGRKRVAIYGHFEENLALVKANPDYLKGIIADATDEHTEYAWAIGSWDIVAGGIFSDVWKPSCNIVRPFAIPASWTITRAFDWGASSPFSVGWYAISDGSDVLIDGQWNSTVRGDLFRIGEWYGWTGKRNTGLDLVPTDIAKGIVAREVDMNLRTTHSCRVTPGPADNQIFGKGNNSLNIGIQMQKRVRLDNNITYDGIRWTRSDKRSGTRIGGWQKMREMLKAAHPRLDGLPREKPGLFIFDGLNEQFERTVPPLARDEIKVEDVADGQEDHVADEVRYMVLDRMKYTGGTGKVVGTY